MAFPPSPIAADKVPGPPDTPSEHPNHHNELANAINDTVARVQSIEAGSIPLTGTLTLPIIRLTGIVDASLFSTGHPFQIGSSSADNLIIDTNEILARNNGAASTLFLQNDGGAINMAGASGGVTIPNATADAQALNRITADGRYVNTAGDSMTAALNIISSSLAENIFVVRGASGHTGRLTRWENSAGTELSTVLANGAILAYDFAVRDSAKNNWLYIRPGSDLTVDRTLTITTGDASRTLTLSADVTLDQSVATTSTPTFSQLTLSTATPSAVGHATRKDYVDTAAGLRVLKAGDTMTGQLYLANPLSLQWSNPTNIGFENGNGAFLANFQLTRWHDLFKFKRYAPAAERFDGAVWTAHTGIDNIFDGKAGTTVELINVTYSAWRCTWVGVAYNYIRQMVFAFAYTDNPARNIVVETSADGVTWTSLATVTGVTWSTNPYTVSLGGGWATADNYARVTITRTAPSGSVTLASIKGLSPRWGNQGIGPEVDYPYDWDANRNVTFTGNASGITPTVAAHLTRKDYVDTADNLRLLKSGGTMTGALTLGGMLNVNSNRIESVGAIERTANVVNASGATEQLDVGLYGIHDVTMDQNCTFTFSNPAVVGYSSFVLILRGGFTPTFPVGVDWIGGANPSQPYYYNPSEYHFSTIDGGSTWFGYMSGSGGSDGFTFMQDTTPTATSNGQTWYDTGTGLSYVWYADVNTSQWVQFSPGGGPDITSWTAVTFENSWVNFGGVQQNAQYRKVGDIVYVRAHIKNGTNTAAAFTLPVGFRPPANRSLPAVSYLSGNFPGRGEVVVTPAGLVVPYVEHVGDVSFEINFSVTA